MNLHLCLPPNTAHPPGVLKSLVYGTLRRYWLQNTMQKDYVNMATKFFHRLQARGHRPEDLKPLFTEAAKSFAHLDPNEVLPKKKKTQSNESLLFFHSECHPSDVPRRAIRQLYNETCGPIQEQLNPKFTVACSRPQNIKEKLTRTQLNEPEGSQATDYLKTLQDK